jgi:hypothetical protein
VPPRIVFDYPNGQALRSLLHFIRVAIGSILVTIGLLATIVAIPTGFVTIGDVLATFSHEPEPVFTPDFPLRECEAAFVASMFVTIVGIRYGRRLVRGRRRAVLFLRRFGYRDSMKAVTFAVMHTIGSSWRLVTLDDAAIAPLGVETVTRVTFGLGERVVRLVTAAGKGVMEAFPWAIGAMCTVIALQLAVAPNWRRALVDGTFDPYFKSLAMVMDHHVPVRYFTPTLSGAFAVLITLFAGLFIGLVVVFVGLLLMMPLFGFVIMATSSAEAMRKAESSKTRNVQGGRDVSAAAVAVSEQGRQTFAPRLTVLRVATPVWQQTVTALAEVTSASVLDVSDPTDNLVWEMDELERLCAGRRILIGEQGRLAQWCGDATVDPESAAARFAARLDGQDVLAYTVDRRGMRRFARALYGKLLDIEKRGN